MFHLQLNYHCANIFFLNNCSNFVVSVKQNIYNKNHNHNNSNNNLMRSDWRNSYCYNIKNISVPYMFQFIKYFS